MQRFILFLVIFFQLAHAQGNLNGVIRDAKTSTGMAGAEVVLDNGSFAITDADGAFQLKDLPVGQLSFSVSYIGYLP